ncbi:hypothetical protein [Planctobacterium marinum]|uniref:Outer membrane lipoprotein carrier protein LolA n=1 Tax=Planctobacterium marinum TaxID=1631968 RepID=A0AA48KR58_9ALTE|nr:hypothetical protein MACH26_27090 [Planctobacterium marinum]
MKKSAIVLGLSLLALSMQSYANSLEKLQARLAQLEGNSPITAQFGNQIENIRGEGKEQRIRTGEASLTLSDDGSGLQVHYSQSLLTKVEQEQQAKADDEDVNTPTMMALENLDAIDFQNMISAGPRLQRFLARSTYVGVQESEEPVAGETVLQFDLPLEVIIDDKKTREYVNKFEGQFFITVAEDGTPLRSNISFHGKGRAWVLMSISAWLERETQYQLSGDRLLQVSRNGKGGFSTSFFPDTSWSSSESLTLGNNAMDMQLSAN